MAGITGKNSAARYGDWSAFRILLPLTVLPVPVKPCPSYSIVIPGRSQPRLRWRERARNLQFLDGGGSFNCRSLALLGMTKTMTFFPSLLSWPFGAQIMGLSLVITRWWIYETA